MLLCNVISPVSPDPTDDLEPATKKRSLCCTFFYCYLFTIADDHKAARQAIVSSHVVNSGADAVLQTEFSDETPPQATEVLDEEPEFEEALDAPPSIRPLSLTPLTVADLSNWVSTCYSVLRDVLTCCIYQYCYLCQNGGKTLRCDTCDRAVCFKHVPQIAAVPELQRNWLHFRCPSCHVRLTCNLKEPAPYFVRNPCLLFSLHVAD